MNSTKRIKLDTPLGSIESDSGSHIVDLVTVLGIVVFILIIKKAMKI
tara:strand:+ start:25854 stop:25994 length:141 start_codon:yes stop_codon:yes gene_type:complete